MALISMERDEASVVRVAMYLQSGRKDLDDVRMILLLELNPWCGPPGWITVGDPDPGRSFAFPTQSTIGTEHNR